jgi:hypothetical protein
MPPWIRLVPRFAVEAHLAALFSSETVEKPEPSLEGGQSDATSPGSLPICPPDAPSVEVSFPEEQPTQARQAASPTPHQLHPSLENTVQEELTRTNGERHDWIERLGEPDRAVIRGTYRRMSDFQVSTTDPDATVMSTKGGGSHLGYHTHYIVDGGKARIILNTRVPPSDVMENQPALDLLWRARFRWKRRPRQFTGDTTYGTAENIVGLEEQLIRAYVPLPDFDQRTTFFGQRDFQYDAERDVYMCPNGAELHPSPSGSTESYKLYWAKAKTCNACPLKAQCTTSSRGRRLSRHVDEEYLERVRAYHQTERYKKAMRKRSVWVEPLKASGKDWHGMRRFRLRGLWRVNSEALMRAAGQNLKRLRKYRGWGSRPWPEGVANALLEPPALDRFSLHAPSLAGQALACAEKLRAWCIAYPLFLPPLLHANVSPPRAKIPPVLVLWGFPLFVWLSRSIFLTRLGISDRRW